MQVMFQFGLRILCDGYVISDMIRQLKHLIISRFLCDGHVIESFKCKNRTIKFLFDGYLINRVDKHVKVLIM